MYLHLTNFLTGIFGFIFFVLQDKASVDPFPIPLAIVGGKYDIYQVSSLLTPEKMISIRNEQVKLWTSCVCPSFLKNLTWLWKMYALQTC